MSAAVTYISLQLVDVAPDPGSVLYTENDSSFFVDFLIYQGAAHNIWAQA